jgi:penicillin G amidase
MKSFPKILKRILLAFLVLVIVIAVAAVIFVWNLSHRAIPDYDRDLPLQGLHAPVEVYRDSFAIPHVYARDMHDLYLATGYLLASDRLWQMDMLRHVTEGRLSEIFGEKFVGTDLILRSLRFSLKSQKILSAADTASLEALNAFADGVNQYIRANAHHLPPEFGILKYKPEEWKPEQSLNMIGYMAWDLKAGWSEILLNEIQKRVDSLRYRQLLPDLTREQPAVYSEVKTKSNPVSVVPDLLLHTGLLQELGADVLDGSNNWAVSGSKSSTGMPLLANDMHLGLNIPGIWYQMHQVTEGGMNVTGLVLPGAPVIICGHNDSIAWGMTNTYVDNLDFYEEKINPADSSQYEFNGEWKNFEMQKVIIKISNGTQIERELRFTHRGAVVSAFKDFPGKVVSMHWVGDEMSNEFRSVLLLNKASNWNDFTGALRTFTSISQNIVYADKKGNIGLYCAAGVPIRKRDISFGVLPGQTDEYDWKGYVPFDQLPHLFNPAQGFVASANNRTASADYPYHIGTWYSLPSRYERITEMLEDKKILSADDFKAIQNDQHSSLAEKYMPAMLKALESFSGWNDNEKKALDLIKNWDYSMDKKSGAAAIFENMYLQLIKCTFADELGSEFVDFNGVTSISRNAMDQLIERKDSPWFDDIATPNKKESINDDIVCSFRAAVSDLEKQMGTDLQTWEWGKIHHLVLAHPLASVKILDRIFNLNRGPYAVGGSFHTVSPYSYDANKPFESNHGSSHRHIFDVANWDNSFTVIPTGNSGIPASRHYCDQTEMYLEGQYHHDYFSKELIMSHARYKMKFTTK